MRRSEEKKVTVPSTATKTPGRAPRGSNANAAVEQAYGLNVSRNSKSKQSPTKSSPTSKGKTDGPSASPIKPKPGLNAKKVSPSSLVAASKASYTEKYGSLRDNPNPTGASSSSNGAIKTAKNHPPTNLALKRSSLGKSVKTNTNGLVPKASSDNLQSNKDLLGMNGSDEPDYDDDDFEEDYPSDFEEVASTEEEDANENTGSGAKDHEVDKESLPQPTSVKASHKNDLRQTESVAEFEKLEMLLDTNDKMLIEDINSANLPNGTNANEDTTDDEENSSIETKKPQLEGIRASEFFTKSGNPSNRPPDYDGKGDNESHSNLLNGARNAGVDSGRVGSSSVSGLRNGNASSTQKGDVSGNATGFMKSADTTVQFRSTAFDFVRANTNLQKKNMLLRGRKLQEMIRFHRVGAELMHLDPSHEQFMISLSGGNRAQIASQTNNDRTDVSAQTEEIEIRSKWTQKPPTWSTTNHTCEIAIVRQEALGVGCDEVLENCDNPDEKVQKQFDFIKNWENLSKFVSRASRKMLYILESEKRLKVPTGSSNASNFEVQMNRGLNILNKLEMSCFTIEGDFVACCNGYPKSDKKKTSKNFITIWSMKEPSVPMYFLRAWGHVSIIKIYSFGHFVASGSTDGTISLWDLDEPPHFHTHYQEQVMRTPSVTTSCMSQTHLNIIIGLAIQPETNNTSLVVSLDKGGIMITWVCIRTPEPAPKSEDSTYSSAWSKISLTVRQTFTLTELLQEPLQITAFKLWKSEDVVEFLVGTTSGCCARGIVMNVLPPLQMYIDVHQGIHPVICFDISLEMGVLATGSSDERCRLYEFSKKQLIVSLDLQGSNPVSLKWSKRRPSVLYVAFTDKIVVWDFLIKELSPFKTVNLENLQAFGIYTTPHKEYTVHMASNQLKIGCLAGETRPLSQKDRIRLPTVIASLQANTLTDK